MGTCSLPTHSSRSVFSSIPPCRLQPSSLSCTASISQLVFSTFFSESGIPSLQWIPQSLKVTLRICVNRLRPPRGTKSGHSVLSISVFRTASADSHGRSSRSSRSRLHTGIEWTGVARWPVGNNAWCVSLQIRVWFIEIMVDGKNQPKGCPLTFTCTHDTCKYSLTQNTQQQTNKTQKLLEV